MIFEKQVDEIKNAFNLDDVKVIIEGGCRFLYLPSFFKVNNEKLDCLFACDDHLGYPNRLWFPRIITTREPRNWNSENIYIAGKNWFAFSMRGKGGNLLELLLSHLMGAK